MLVVESVQHTSLSGCGVFCQESRAQNHGGRYREILNNLVFFIYIENRMPCMRTLINVLERQKVF
jgi:hypothetical protein